MPRVLIPETADPYLGTGVRPIVTGTSKRDLFETLPRALQLGDAIGNSQAVGALLNLGEMGIEKLQQASAAAKLRQAELDKQGADEDAGPSPEALAKAREVGIGVPAQGLARKDEDGYPYMGRHISEEMSPGRVTVYPKAPDLPVKEPLQPPMRHLRQGEQPPARSPEVAKLIKEYNDYLAYMRANPAQQSNPLHHAHIEGLKRDIQEQIDKEDADVSARNAAAQADYDQRAAAHAQVVTNLSRQREAHNFEQQAALRAAREEHAAAAAEHAALRGTSEPPRELPVAPMTPEQEDRLRSRLRMELAEKGPAAAQALAAKVRRAFDAARGVAPAADVGVDDSGGSTPALGATPSGDSAPLPGFKSAEPAGLEDKFYNTSRGLGPVDRGAMASPPVSAAPEPKTYADFAALARAADTKDKQADLLRRAQSARIFQPRTLFERLSGDHEVRGIRGLVDLFPSGGKDLEWARYAHQVEKDKEAQQFREAEARRKGMESGREYERKVADAKRKGAEEKAKLDQRVSEFEFESGDKFEETKRHNKETERIGWAQAKNNINKADREAKNSPDLKGALDVYKGRSNVLDKEEQESVEKAQAAEREAQAAEAAAVQAVKAARTTPPPANRRDKTGAETKAAADNEARDAARAAKAKRAAAIEAKKQHDSMWAPGSAKRTERDELRKRVDKISQELEKRGKMPAAED